MAGVALSVLRAKVRLRTNSVSTDTRLTDAVLLGTINDALRQVTLEQDWPWLLTEETITTVAADGSYPVPADYLRTFSIVDNTTGLALEPRSAIEMDQYQVLTGTPSAYHSYGDAILLGPLPAQARTYRHRYVQIENVLATDADTALIPVEFSEGVVEWASRLAFTYIRDSAKAAEAEAGYYAWLSRIRDNMKRTKQPIRPRVRPGAWF